MNTRTITSANAILMLGVTGLYDVAQKVQGFTADDIFDSDAVEPVETNMGLDRRLSAGYVPVAVPQNITLQADSESNDLFENVYAAESALGDKYVWFGLVVLPATGRKYNMTRGFLRSIPVMPSAKKTLQPRRYGLLWERVTPAPN